MTRNIDVTLGLDTDRLEDVLLLQGGRMLSTHEKLKRKIEEMESKYDEQFSIVFEAIKQLIEAKEKPKRKIGFEVREAAAAYSKQSRTKMA